MPTRDKRKCIYGNGSTTTTTAELHKRKSCVDWQRSWVTSKCYTGTQSLIKCKKTRLTALVCNVALHQPGHMWKKSYARKVEPWLFLLCLKFICCYFRDKLTHERQCQRNWLITSLQYISKQKSIQLPNSSGFNLSACGWNAKPKTKKYIYAYIHLHIYKIFYLIHLPCLFLGGVESLLAAAKHVETAPHVLLSFEMCQEESTRK